MQEESAVDPESGCTGCASSKRTGKGLHGQTGEYQVQARHDGAHGVRSCLYHHKMCLCEEDQKQIVKETEAWYELKVRGIRGGEHEGDKEIMVLNQALR